MPHANLTETQRAELTARLEKNPGIILEQLAETNACSLQEVLDCLPATMRQRTEGTRFVEFMQAISAWQTPVTVIVHTADVILEFTGPLPEGALGHGFYNLHGSAGLHGHLRHDRCGAIYLIERPFMGKTTVSLNFMNSEGGAMLKLYVGRDASGTLLQEQIEALRAFFSAEACAA
ncbi:MAG: heme utilization cystosolic carrier protein HutX [Candidatus Dactylopiibacterium sp.]|nr:heme utilization cystosolic carrier protein HutX [Candidatus Dactylopiibacterium sp.]